MTSRSALAGLGVTETIGDSSVELSGSDPAESVPGDGRLYFVWRDA